MPIKQIFIPRHELNDILVALLVSVAEEAWDQDETYIEDIFRHGVTGVTSMSDEEVIEEIMSLTDGALRNCFATISRASKTFASQYKTRSELDQTDLVLEVLKPKVVKLDELAFKLAQYEAEHADSETLAELLHSGCDGWANKSVSEMMEYINFNITDESFQDLTGLRPGMPITIGNLPVKLHEEVNEEEA